MIQKQIVKQPKSIVELTITMPWEDIAPKYQETLQRLAQEVEIAGFRKGTAPLEMVETQLGNKITDELFKNLFPQALVESLQGSNIVPIDFPRYQIISFAKGQTLTFKATITEKPEVKVGEYKTINVSRPVPRPVTDEEVEKIVADLFNRYKTNQPAAVSTTPDDGFAVAMGALNLVDLKSKIKADLEAQSKFDNELDYEEAILQEVEKITQVEVPQILVEDELHRMLVSLQKKIADSGLLMDEYLKSQNETLESLRNKWLPQAEKNVRMELGLSEIARLESVAISDAELQSEVDKITDVRLKQQFDQQEPRMQLKHSLRQVKTLDLLKSLVKST